MKNVLTIMMLFIFVASVTFCENSVLKLPSPQKEIGLPLMQCLQKRQSAREFNTKSLPFQEISNLLWAGFGINRPETGKRTAPSSMNNQEVEIYVVLAEGVYLYNAKDNQLELTVVGDIREFCGKQDYVKTAPVNFVYVADFSKMGKGEETDKMLTAGADVGFIAQNVYLYCASQGLNVVIRAFIDKPLLAKKMKLKESQKVILSQTIGYPK